MIQHEDGSVSLEGDEKIDLRREIDWVVNDWMPDEKYVGALVFPESGRAAGYILFPYDDPSAREAA